MRFKMSSGGSALIPRAHILDHELLRVRAAEIGPEPAAPTVHLVSGVWGLSAGSQ
jgi:hypothetical protein